MSYHLSSTSLLIVSGILIWAGVFVVFSGGTFALWTVAKGLYVVGALLFLFNK